MKKRLLSLVMALAMVICLVPAVNAEASARTKKNALKAYYSYIKSGKPKTYADKKYNKFLLKDLDKDKIPELIAMISDRDQTYIDNYVIMSFDGNKVNTLELSEGVAGVGGFRGSVSYNTKKRTIYQFTFSSGTGAEYSTVYSLKNGAFKKKAYITAEYVGSTKKYKWNGKSVTLKQRDAKLKKAHNPKNAKSFAKLKYISRNKMLKKLK